jgi:hypothetical protein
MHRSKIEGPRYPSSVPGGQASVRRIIVMIDHTGIGVADVARSAAFYDAALGALGLRRATVFRES